MERSPEYSPIAAYYARSIFDIDDYVKYETILYL